MASDAAELTCGLPAPMPGRSSQTRLGLIHGANQLQLGTEPLLRHQEQCPVKNDGLVSAFQSALWNN